MRVVIRTLIVGTLVAALAAVAGAQPPPGAVTIGSNLSAVDMGLACRGPGDRIVAVVPVPAVNDGVDALVQGRADVTEHALGAAL
jgi:hypothetical protein